MEEEEEEDSMGGGSRGGGTNYSNRKRSAAPYFFMTSLVLRVQADTQEITRPIWRDAPTSRSTREVRGAERLETDGGL